MTTKVFPYAFSKNYVQLFEQIMKGNTLIAILEERILGHTIQRLCVNSINIPEKEKGVNWEGLPLFIK